MIDFYFVVILIACLFFISLVSSDEWEAIGQLSYNLMKEENFEIHGTKLFRHQSGLHVRHDLDVHLALQLKEHCDVNEPFKFKLIENEDSTVFVWTQIPLIQFGEFHFHLHVNQSIPVGQYTLNSSYPCSNEKDKMVRLCDVNLMFNPGLTQWDTSGNKRVRRLIPSSAFVDEYICNDYGYIWLGNKAISWNYAVDSQIVKDSKNRLLQQMNKIERSSKVECSRALTRLIGNHVLLGRWDGDYSDGVEPTQWVGSEHILAIWFQYGQRVRYAQCWVFAAILTTILRALGIPARTVTNYNSHHDRGLIPLGDGSVIVRQYDNVKQPDESIWNFHVWSEAWLERPDLGQPAEWNAVDATPQEPSPLELNQPYRAGPAYVPYIRLDRRNENYDTYFVLAEVNARRICPTTGRFLPTDAGYAVVTKLPGRHPAVYYYNNPEYITNNYKIPSTSKRASDSARPELPPPYTGCERDGGMRLNITPVSPRVSENFTITVTEGNVSVEDTVIRMELRNYMGESLGIIRNFVGIRQLIVTENDYLPYLGNTSIFRFSVGVYNESENFVFHDALRIRLEYNQLQVEAIKIANNSDTITLTVMYTNPLSIPMSGVMVSISGPNNVYMRMEQPDIPANGHFTATVSVQCGDNDDSDVMIPISLDSDETQSVYGTGWSSCREEPSNGGIIMLSEISSLKMILLSLFALYLYT